MSSGAAFRRLVKLYRVVENLHAAQAKTAALAAEEIEQARMRSHADHAAELLQARQGLLQGNRIAVLASDHAAEGWDALQRQLHAMAAERSALREAATITHRLSQMELRQVERLVEKQAAATRTIEERRAQSESDDRFLSRREWLRMRRPRG